MHLGHAAKTVRILHAAAIDVRLTDVTLAEESRQPFGHLKLPAMRSRFMNSRIECGGRSLQRLEGHCACQIRQVQQALRAPPADDACRQCRLRSVQKREAFLRLKIQGLDSDSFKRLAAGDFRRCAEDFTFANQH